MFQRFKNFRKLRKWYVVKLKLVDARLYFVSIFVGLLTGLVAVPYHYCLYYFFNLRSELSPEEVFLKHVLPSTGALLISILS